MPKASWGKCAHITTRQAIQVSACTHTDTHTYTCSRNIDTTCSDSHPDDPTKRIVAPYWQSKRRAKLSLPGRQRRRRSEVGVPDPWSSASYSSSPSSCSSPPSVLLFNLILPILKRFAPRQSNSKQQLPRALVLLLLLLLLLLLCFQLPEFENSFTSIMPNKG